MSTTTTKETTLDLLIEAPTSNSDFPAWFNEARAEAWKSFQELEGPSRKNENWRFAALKKVSLDGFAKSIPSSDGLIERSTAVEKSAARLVFANDELLIQEGKLPEGVICLPLNEALKSHPEVVENHFKAQVSGGTFIYVPKNVTVEGVIEVFHWVGGVKSLSFPHTLVVAEEGAKVSVVDHFQSINDSDASWVLSVNDLSAAKGAQLKYVALQDLNLQSRAIQINTTSVGAAANARSFIMNTGCTWARQENLSRLEGEEARSDMLSLNLPHGDQEFDQRTFQHHVSRGAYSDLLYKNTLFDQTKTVFAGLIFVDEGAHDTDAYQTCRNLMMSNEAEAHSMPGLEINADQVKCSHGSTSAKVSDEEIFYLQARGIDAESACRMIAHGFSTEVIERLEDETLEELVLKEFEAKFI